jgi:LmbE family N-acetylglucosaminyl deacetylase
VIRVIVRWLGALIAGVAVLGLAAWVALSTRLTVPPKEALENGEQILQHSRVLVVVAHPDDADWWISGTLKRLVDHGAQVLLVVASDGEKGPNRIGAKDLPATRREEQKAAQAVIGYQDLRFLGLPDREVVQQPNVLETIEEIGEEFQPTLVITFDPDTPDLPYLHPDHEGIGRVVKQWLEKRTQPVEIAFFHTRRPNAAVEITDVYEAKLQALRQHRSQGLDRGGFSNRPQMAKNGSRVGVPLAETFRLETM